MQRTMTAVLDRWRRAQARGITPEAFLVLCDADTFYMIDRSPRDLSLLDNEVGYDDTTGTRVYIVPAQTMSDP